MKTETDRWEDDGGPAFTGPQVHQVGDEWKPYPGLSVRDYFAGQVLIGLVSNNKFHDAVDSRGLDPMMTMANSSYSLADAMLRAREHGDE